MCLIQPFRVARHSFLRDVGFFTVAVTFTLFILWDNHIHAWEASAMVGLYGIYVMTVATGSWWMARQERIEKRIRAAREEYASEGLVGEYRDEREWELCQFPLFSSNSLSFAIFQPLLLHIEEASPASATRVSSPSAPPFRGVRPKRAATRTSTIPSTKTLFSP